MARRSRVWSVRNLHGLQLCPAAQGETSFLPLFPQKAVTRPDSAQRGCRRAVLLARHPDAPGTPQRPDGDPASRGGTSELQPPPRETAC